LIDDSVIFGPAIYLVPASLELLYSSHSKREQASCVCPVGLHTTLQASPEGSFLCTFKGLLLEDALVHEGEEREPCRVVVIADVIVVVVVVVIV